MTHSKLLTLPNAFNARAFTVNLTQKLQETCPLSDDVTTVLKTMLHGHLAEGEFSPEPYETYYRNSFERLHTALARATLYAQDVTGQKHLPDATICAIAATTLHYEWSNMPTDILPLPAAIPAPANMSADESIAHYAKQPLGLVADTKNLLYSINVFDFETEIILKKHTYWSQFDIVNNPAYGNRQEVLMLMLTMNKRLQKGIELANTDPERLRTAKNFESTYIRHAAELMYACTFPEGQLRRDNMGMAYRLVTKIDPTRARKLTMS